MPINLDNLLTVLPPFTGPFMGKAPPSGNVDTATCGYQIKLGAHPGIGTPICVIFLPVSAALPPGPITALPPLTCYSAWIGHSETSAIAIPDRLWHGLTGLLPLLLYLHDGRLVDTIPFDNNSVLAHSSLRSLTMLFDNMEGTWNELPDADRPDRQSFKSALHGKLLAFVNQAAKGPTPIIIGTPDGLKPRPQPLKVASQSGLVAEGAPNTRSLCWMLGSCTYQGGFVDRALADASWEAGPADASIARLLDWQADASKPQPSLALLMGDQIYSDATAGLFDPRSLDGRFRQPYLDAQTDRFLQAAWRQMEVHSMIDDHEIENDWAPLPASSPRHQDNLRKLAWGLRSYRQYQQFSAPGTLPIPTPNGVHPSRILDDYFEREGFAFLLLDTRTHRQHRDALNVHQAELIAPYQWQAVLHMLQLGREPNPVFIGSPSILLPRRLSSDAADPASALFSDAWDGYPRSLYALLAALHRAQAHNVIFLSGDEHLSCICQFTVTCTTPGQAQAPVTSHSVHSSALYAPYPFANGHEAALNELDDFTFADPLNPQQTYRCLAQTTFAPPGDGFAILQAITPHPTNSNHNWALNVMFSRGDQSQPTLTTISR